MDLRIYVNVCGSMLVCSSSFDPFEATVIANAAAKRFCQTPMNWNRFKISVVSAWMMNHHINSLPFRWG